MSTDEVLNTIDAAVNDFTVSHDAMRFMPDRDDRPLLEAVQDQRRALVCSHEFFTRVAVAVEAAGLADDYNVVASSALTGDAMFLFNDPAMEDHFARQESRLYRMPVRDFFAEARWPINLTTLNPS